MPGQDELFQLIKCLTPSEKRYFKVHASKSGDSKSNYILLFEAMDNQRDSYDEQELKRQHAEQPFIKYLSAEKKHLREQILKFMRAYYSERSVDNKINELIQDASFFRDKGLKSLREKTMSKAKELAQKFERYHLLQWILEMQVKYVEEFEEKNLMESESQLLNELTQLSVQQQTYALLWSRNKEIFAAYRSGADMKAPMVRNRIESAIAEVELFRNRLGNSFILKHQFYSAYFHYYALSGNPTMAYEYSTLQYELFQEFPQFKKEFPMLYKVCVANLISRCRLAGKTERFLSLIEELRSLPVTSFNEEGEVFQNVYFSEHLHYINSGEFDKAEQLIPEIESGLIRYADKINRARYLSFLYNIMVMYFVMHRFKEASKWADRLLADKSEIKQNATTATRILMVIIHYELGHHDIVENLTRSAYRYLKSKNRLHGFERLMIRYLKEMPFTVNRAVFRQHLDRLSDDMKALQADPNEPVVAGMEEVSLWVRSKMHNTTMVDLLSKN